MTKSVEMPNLQVFVTVAEERNMSNAAKKLGLTQSAVSQSIRQMEESFGVVLINRERRPLSLTAAGHALKNRATVLLAEISHLRNVVIDASRGVQPDLRIGLVDSFAGTVGPTFVQQLLRHAATLSVQTGLSPYHGESLLARDLDVVVSTEPLIDFDNIWRHRLLSERFIVITSFDHGATIHNVEDLRRLAQSQPIVRFSRSSHMGTQIERLLRRHHVHAPYKLELDRADNVTSMVAAGLGWAITTPMCLMQAGDFARRVRPRYLVDCTDDRSIYLLGRQAEYDRLLHTFASIAIDVLAQNVPPYLDSLDPNLKLMLQIDELSSPASIEP